MCVLAFAAAAAARAGGNFMVARRAQNQFLNPPRHQYFTKILLTLFLSLCANTRRIENLIDQCVRRPLLVLLIDRTLLASITFPH
jgi:hypothetical protein